MDRAEFDQWLEEESRKMHGDAGAEAASGKSKNTVANAVRTGIMESITGARNPYGKAADEHAERYYNLV